jgi:hypothetical protein
MTFWWSGDCSSNLQLTSEMTAVIVIMEKSDNELIGAIVVCFAKLSRGWSRGPDCQETMRLIIDTVNMAMPLAIRRGWEGRHRETFRLTSRFFPQLCYHYVQVMTNFLARPATVDRFLEQHYYAIVTIKTCPSPNHNVPSLCHAQPHVRGR